MKSYGAHRDRQKRWRHLHLPHECVIWLQQRMKSSARLINNRILSFLIKCKLIYIDRKRGLTRVYLRSLWYNKSCIKALQSPECIPFASQLLNGILCTMCADILTQIPRSNAQKINEEGSWKVISDEKRNRSNLEMIMSHKQSKTDNYWLSKVVPIFNRFEALEEIFDDINDNERAETVKFPSTFVVRVISI